MSNQPGAIDQEIAPRPSVRERVGAVLDTLKSNRNVQIDLVLTAVGAALGALNFHENALIGGAGVGALVGSLVGPILRAWGNYGRQEQAISGYAVDRTQHDTSHFAVTLAKSFISGQPQFPEDSQPDPESIRREKGLRNNN